MVRVLRIGSPTEPPSGPRGIQTLTCPPLWANPTADRRPARCGILIRSEHYLRLHPHRADPAIGEIAIQETPGRRSHYDHRRNLDELRMIKRVERLPTQLQAPLLAHENRFGQVQVEVIRAAGVQRIAADRG